jgi:hypothetical protein
MGHRHCQVFAAPAHFIAKPVDAGKWFEMPIQGRELGQPLNWIREIVAWISANTFGRRILYPGSLAVFHSMVNGQLIDGRRKLVEERVGRGWAGLFLWKAPEIGGGTEHCAHGGRQQAGHYFRR